MSSYKNSLIHSLLTHLMFKTPIVYYSVDHVFKGFKLSWGYNISSRSETTTSYPDQWEILFYKVLPDGKKLDIHKAELSRESFQMETTD